MGPAATAPAGRILALDLGDARVGVALSDALGLTARPYATLPFRGEKALAREIAALVRAEDAAEVLVGHPVGPRGAPTARSEAAERFARRLEPAVRRPVRLVDERLSTVQAEENLRRAGLGARERRERIDQESACVLLQEELDRRRAAGAGA